MKLACLGPSSISTVEDIAGTASLHTRIDMSDVLSKLDQKEEVIKAKERP